MYTVGVLMSTYNGEKYLREQIDSILSQKDVDVHIYVRDDGSSDNTVNILREYEKTTPNFQFRGGAKNIGFGSSFMELVYSVPKHDYYAFSDQDDVWRSDKLISAINLIKESGKENLPTLYYSNLEICDENLNSNGLLHYNFDHIPVNKFNTVFCCYLYGNTLVFNHKLMEKVRLAPNKNPLKHLAHDWELRYVAAFLGELVYDKEPHILYRQHSSNLSYSEKSDHLLLKMLQKFLSLFKKSDHARLKMLKWFYENYGEYIQDYDKKVIEELLSYRKDFCNKISLIFNHKLLKSPVLYRTIFNILLILFNEL